MERPVNESIFAFLSGWWVGRRQRRNSGLSILILLVSLCACLSGFTMVFLGVPVAFLRSREAAALPRPNPTQLSKLARGSHVLVVAQIPPDAPTDSHGLSLFYVQARKERRSADGQATRSSSSSEWEIVEPPPPRFEMLLEDGSSLSVQFSPTLRPFDRLRAPQAQGAPSFLNAQSFETEEENGQPNRAERRYVGYLPGQTLTVEGRWEGNGLFTADASYAGRPEDYVEYLRTQIGASFLMGIICGGIGLVLLLVGGFMRMMGR